MRKAFTLFIVLVTLTASFSRAFVIMGFLLHQSAIAKTLCENRKNPMKHCNGKCYLNKQLSKDEKKDKSSLPTSGNEIFEELVWVNQSPFIFYNPADAVSLTTPLYADFAFSYSHFHYSEIPHPPSVG